MKFRKASPIDVPKIIELLKAHGLPTEDVQIASIDLFVGLEGENIIACGGLEVFLDHALLRSVAVDNSITGKGFGSSLIQYILDQSKSLELEAIYLRTETAEQFFKKHGFNTIGREEIPKSILSSREFSDLCPASAISMSLEN